MKAELARRTKPLNQQAPSSSGRVLAISKVVNNNPIL